MHVCCYAMSIRDDLKLQTVMGAYRIVIQRYSTEGQRSSSTRPKYLDHRSIVESSVIGDEFLRIENDSCHVWFLAVVQ